MLQQLLQHYTQCDYRVEEALSLLWIIRMGLSYKSRTSRRPYYAQVTSKGKQGYGWQAAGATFAKTINTTPD